MRGGYSALQQAGKSVLHLDKNPYYGSDYAAFNFNAFVEWLNGVDTAAFDAPESTVVSDADALAVVADKIEGAAAMPAVREGHVLAQGLPTDGSEEMAEDAFRYVFDLSPRATLCRGSLVERLTATGLGDYVEFKIVDGTYVYAPQGNYTASSGAAGAGGDGTSTSVRDGICKVPCSKADIFTGKFLTLLEKRTLMKFLQFCMDWHVASQGADVQTRNEAGLGQSRSLTRPQNKARATIDYAKYADLPFVTFLREGCKLSDKLVDVVAYSVALLVKPLAADAERPLTSEQGMRALTRYINSLGRFGTTAFIASMYGTSELPQAFSRICAVYGGIYMLRTPVSHIITGTKALPVETPADSPEVVVIDDKDSAESDGTDSGDEAGDRFMGVVSAEGRFFSGRWLVANPEYVPELCSTEHHARVARCVCVTDGPIVAGEKRLSLVIPPRSAPFNNPFAVQILQFDDSSGIAAKGKTLVHASTLCTNDEATAPVSETLSSLRILRHVVESMTKSTDSELDETGHSGGAAMRSKADATGAPSDGDGKEPGDAAPPAGIESTPAASAALAGEGSDEAATSESDSRPNRLWIASFVQNVHYVSASRACPKNVYVTAPFHHEDRETAGDHFVEGEHDGPCQVHHERAVALARSIFDRICPGQEFLAKRSQPDEEDVSCLRRCQIYSCSPVLCRR